MFRAKCPLEIKTCLLNFLYRVCIVERSTVFRNVYVFAAPPAVAVCFRPGRLGPLDWTHLEIVTGVSTRVRNRLASRSPGVAALARLEDACPHWTSEPCPLFLDPLIWWTFAGRGDIYERLDDSFSCTRVTVSSKQYDGFWEEEILNKNCHRLFPQESSLCTTHHENDIEQESA